MHVNLSAAAVASYDEFLSALGVLLLRDESHLDAIEDIRVEKDQAKQRSTQGPVVGRIFEENKGEELLQ
jgi:hypothetical protein